MLKYIMSFMMVTSAFAAETPQPWTVDMTIILKDDDGKPIPDAIACSGKQDSDMISCMSEHPLHLGDACSHALNIITQDEQKTVDGETRWSWSRWAHEIRNSKAVQLDSSQQKLLIDRLGKIGYSGMVLNSAFPYIDPNHKPPPIK
jgi:hypothetical protein